MPHISRRHAFGARLTLSTAGFLLVCLPTILSAESLQHEHSTKCDHPTLPPVQFAPLFHGPDSTAKREKGSVIPQKFSTSFSNGVVMNSDYDNGSLGGISFAGESGGVQTYNASLFVEDGELGTRSYWFRFTMDNVAGETLRINLDHRQNDFPVVRFFSTANQEWSDWRRLTGSEVPDSFSMLVSPTADQDLIELAFFYPLGMNETYDAVNEIVAQSPFVTVSTPALKSFQGNDFQTVTVNDTRFPDDEKHGIWVHSRAHAGEVTSTWLLLGYLEQFAADDEIGARLRRYCRLDMLTLQNVDGVELGHTRWDSQGVDPERWSDATNPGVPGCLLRSPAIPSQTMLKQLLDERIASDAPPEVVLNLHSTVGQWDDTFFFQRNLGGQANVQQSFRTILQNYVDAFDNATPLFQNADPQFSFLNTCSSTSSSRFVESYMYTVRGEDTMAMTHEGYFQNRGYGDFGYWTAEEYKEIGRAQARALIEYLDLPECDTPDPFVSIPFDQIDHTRAGNGIELPLFRSDESMVIDLFAERLEFPNPTINYDLIETGITETTYNYLPAEGDGVYVFRLEGTDRCNKTDEFISINNFVSVVYNDIENSAITLDHNGATRVPHPMTDDISVIFNNDFSPPEGTFSTVSREVNPTPPQGLDPTKVINESITIDTNSAFITSSFSLFVEAGVDPGTNPLGLTIEAAYLFRENESEPIVFDAGPSFSSQFGIEVFNQTFNPSGTWFFGEANAFSQNVDGDFWIFDE